MASLAQTISENKKLIRKPGGQLVEDTGQDTQKLAQDQGIPAAPTTAAGVGLIGGTPAQQGQAGTPMQKQQALAQSSEGSLAESMRRQQARTQATSHEAAAKEKEQKLGELSTLQQRAQSFIQAATAKPVIQKEQLTTQAALVADAASALGVPASDANFNADAQRLAAGGFADANLLADLANRAGLDENTFATRLKNLQLGTEQQTAASATAAAKAVQDKATVNDLIQAGGLQYQPADLANLLGVPEDQIANMSVDDLQAKITEVEQAEYSRVQDLQAQVNNPNLGPAERAAAQQALAEMSGVGVRSSEAQVQRIDEAVQRGDEITFGGKQYKLADLLNDATISQVAADYIRNPNSPDSLALRKENPDFAAFLDQNKETFNKAAQALESGIQTIKTAQEAKNELLKQTGIDKDMAEAMMPGFKKLSTKGAVPPPILQGAMKDPAIKESLQGLQNNPGVLKELASLDANQVADLGIGQTGSKWDNWKTAQVAVAELNKRYNVAPNNPDAVLDAYFAEDVVPAVVEEAVQSNMGASAFGFENANYEDYKDLLGPDGTLRPSQDILSDLKSKAPTSYSIKDALNNAAVPNAQALRKMRPQKFSGSAIQESIVRKFGRMAAGGINAQEAEQAPLDFDELLTLEGKGWGPKVDDEAKGVLAQKLAKNRKDFTSNLLQKLPDMPDALSGDWAKWKRELQQQVDAIRGGPDAAKLDNAMLEEILNPKPVKTSSSPSENGPISFFEGGNDNVSGAKPKDTTSMTDAAIGRAFTPSIKQESNRASKVLKAIKKGKII